MNRRNFLKVVAASIGVQPALCKDEEHNRHCVEFWPDRVVVGPLRPPAAMGLSLQEAIDGASAHGCRIVELLAGTYRTGRLTITQPLWLKGAPGETILETVGARTSSVVVHPPGGLPLISSVRISGLVFRGESLAPSGGTDLAAWSISSPPIDRERLTAVLAAQCAEELTVTDCRFERACNAAVALWRCEGAQVTENFVEGSLISFYSRAGRGNVFAGNEVGNDVELGVYVAHQY
jgi:hypothetical protein